MRQIRQSNIVPARVRHARPITRLEGVDCASEIRPGKILHDDAGVVRTTGDAAAFKLGLVRALVCVRLGHEDGERDVVGSDVRPRNVLRQTLSTFPGLEPRGIDSINHSDIVESHVRDVGKGRLILAKRSNAHSMTLIPNGPPSEKNIA